MTATTAALATVVLLFVLLAIVAAYGIYANIKLQKEIDAEGDGKKMIKYNFTKMSREQLAKIAENAIKALADKRSFDVFAFTLEVDGDESDIEIIKEVNNGSK